MVGMMVGDEEARDRVSGDTLGKDALPQPPGDVVADAAVDERPGRLPGQFVLEQPQVDVVEGERQRHARPVHPRRDLQRLASRGRSRPGIFKDGFGSHGCSGRPSPAVELAFCA